MVESTAYRWLIRRKATYSQTDYGRGSIHVAIELATDPGTSLVIYTDRGHPGDWNTKEVVPVTPVDVSIWITQALQQNWHPERGGVQQYATVEDNVLKFGRRE